MFLLAIRSTFLILRLMPHAKINSLLPYSALHFMPCRKYVSSRCQAVGVCWKYACEEGSCEHLDQAGFWLCLLWEGGSVPFISYRTVGYDQPLQRLRTGYSPGLPALLQLYINTCEHQNPVLVFYKIFWEPITESTTEKQTFTVKSSLVVKLHTDCTLQYVGKKAKRFCFICVI